MPLTIPKTKSSQRNRRSLIRLIENGPREDLLKEGPEWDGELLMMNGLIEAGMANGHVAKDGMGKVVGVDWHGPTLAGQLFVDELRDSVDRSTWSHRLKTASVWFLGWIMGILSAVIVRLIAP